MIVLAGVRFFWGLNVYAWGEVAAARLRCEPAVPTPPPAPAEVVGQVSGHLARAGLPPAPVGSLVDMVRWVADAALGRCGAPTSAALRLRPGIAGTWAAAVPLDHADTADAAFRLAAGLVSAVGRGVDAAAIDAALGARLDALARGWERWRPDVEQAEILAACDRRGVRWKRLSYFPDCIQLGEGRRQKRLLTTVTGETGHIAVRLSNDKSLTNLRLAQQGVPVPRHRIVDSAAEAARTARDHGLPVVVKPRDGR